jgi:hypothetical protein
MPQQLALEAQVLLEAVHERAHPPRAATSICVDVHACPQVHSPCQH